MACPLLEQVESPDEGTKRNGHATGYPVNAATILILQNLGNTIVRNALKSCM
jgi:hypothetical protein